MEAGGSVLWLIAVLVFFMWGMIFERIWYFSHGHSVYVKDLAEKWNSRNNKEHYENSNKRKGESCRGIC